MPVQDFNTVVNYEHRFWLQILGDHARFLSGDLAITERNEIQQADRFVLHFDQLLEQARRGVTQAEIHQFNRQVMDSVRNLKTFKLNLLRRHLTENLASNTAPSLISHMVNELEEYEAILRLFEVSKLPPEAHPLHYHLLWLFDAVAHAASVSSGLDLAERNLREESQEFEQDFCRLHSKAQELAGYLRTNLMNFPALSRFNQEVNLVIIQFMAFLAELKNLSLQKELLGTAPPLIFDHMYREECYYLGKLAKVSQIQSPNCDPTAPRITG